MKELSDKEVLQAAMQKTIENGWDAYGWPNWQVWGEDTVMFYDKTQEIDDTKWVHRGNELELSTILFDHEFCKALWRDAVVPNEEEIDENHSRHGLYSAEGGGYEGYGDYVFLNFEGEPWQYHGTQMFLAEDRIDYLRKHLDV